MKHEQRAEHAVAVTRSKGKMYEYKIPENAHLALPPGLVIEELFPLVIGTVGDYAAETVARFLEEDVGTSTLPAELRFAALALSAYVESRFDSSISDDLLLVSAAAFYLSDMPGNAIVQRRTALPAHLDEDAAGLKHAVRWILGFPWKESPPEHVGMSIGTTALCSALFSFYQMGQDADWTALVRAQRDVTYARGSAAELLYSDIFCATLITRLNHSARKLLPRLSGTTDDGWAGYFSQESALQELWPSQRLFGQAGILAGASAIVQMPTSAGKTRAIELVLRTTFLSKRASLALIVAPFRALCEEIAQNLSVAFQGESVAINHLADALQPDYLAVFSELLGLDHEPLPHVVVLTPEKLLYVLRQRPDLVSRTGAVVYDEGHQFDNGSRGVAYELLITSIKKLLPLTAQTVLVSAVIQNAPVLARWLLNDETAVLADSTLQTQRTIAFTSWETAAGQLRFFDRANAPESFFVPRALVQQELQRFNAKEKVRYFPEQKKGGSVALYLALRILENGGVAIFCGKKDSVPPLLKHALEVFARQVSFPPPSSYCDPTELSALVGMYERNFGENSYLTNAAKLGFFAHHSDTPHGFRLAVEHAMRERLIRLVVCTSTLAQGVNLPIRYLLVTGTRQGAEQIPIRDFQNLMGRAGRAGIHNEGTVVFTDPQLFDKRNVRRESWRWHEANQLLTAELTEPTGSELLTLVAPLKNDDPRTRLIIPMDPKTLIDQIFKHEQRIRSWIDNLPANYVTNRFSSASLHRQVDRKRSAVIALQSYLMANQPTALEEMDNSFSEWARGLARETFAYSLADESQRAQLEEVFAHVASDLEQRVPDSSDRSRFGKTLLGVDDILVIDAWASEHVDAVEKASDEVDVLRAIWPLLMRLCRRKQLLTLEPSDAIQSVVERWLEGAPYSVLLEELTSQKATFAWGTKRRAFDIDQVVGICEKVFWFDFPLIIAALRDAIYEKLNGSEERAAILRRIDLAHRRFKYGLPSQNCTYFFDLGFVERQLCIDIADVAWGNIDSVESAQEVVKNYKDELEPILANAPAYFQWTFRTVTA